MSTRWRFGQTVQGRLATVATSIVATTMAFGLLAGTTTACTAIQTVGDQRQQQRTFLKLDIQPDNAQLYIDGEYRGRADGWSGGLVPVDPGPHRVKLTADGYITQRFDIKVESGDRHTLEVDMQRELVDFE